MMKFALVVETGSDLPAAIAEEYGVYMAPMHAAFGSDNRDDGAFPVEDIYRSF